MFYMSQDRKSDFRSHWNTIQYNKYLEIEGTSWTNSIRSAHLQKACAQPRTSPRSLTVSRKIEPLSKPTVAGTMAGATSLEAVKRKIRLLQEKTDASEEKAERLQRELLANKKCREQVSIFYKGYRVWLELLMHNLLVVLVCVMCVFQET